MRRRGPKRANFFTVVSFSARERGQRSKVVAVTDRRSQTGRGHKKTLTILTVILNGCSFG